MITGKTGIVTLMPILSMPAGDITHPVPDLTGYITEGQLILQRELCSEGIYPAMNVLPSLIRLMKDGIGAKTTRKDHQDVSNQLYMAYAEGTRARGLVRIVGIVGLSERERTWLEFADAFENKFVNQGTLREQDHRTDPRPRLGPVGDAARGEPNQDPGSVHQRVPPEVP